jgi:hypothetical protein
MDTQIKSLLEFPSDFSEKGLKDLAQEIMNKVCIFNGKYKYHPIEIEFYMYDKDKHPDILVYPRDAKEAGTIFFHMSGIDICFQSSIETGLFGGILIRAIERDSDGKQFGGPLICKDEILNSAAGKCVTIPCDKELNYNISKITLRKGFKDSKGLKDIYWDKGYRFVREDVQKPIIRKGKEFDPNTGELMDKDRKYYL